MANEMNWDERAATWDGGDGQRAYARSAFAALQDAAARYGLDLSGARIVDFGCGTGLLTEKLAGQAEAIDAVDRSQPMLAVLEAKKARLGWEHVHLHTQMPTDGALYDLIVCSSVCAFLPDYPGTIKQMVQRLRPGGLFVQWDWELDPDAEAGMGLSRQSVRACLAGAALEVLMVETGFTATVGERTMRPLMGVGRVLPR